MPANIERGEVAIILDGKEYVMVPSYANLAKIESETKRTIIDLLRSIAMVNCRISDMANIVGISAGIDVAIAGGMLIKAGYSSDPILNSAATFLNNALTGGKKPKGEAVAATDQNQP
jgi:hypothetical protein